MGFGRNVGQREFPWGYHFLPGAGNGCAVT